mgnify:CR=1 FL=1
MNKEKILVVGSGAREHAICRSISRSNKPHKLFCLGSNNNPGIISTCSTFQVGDINDPEIVLSFAKKTECATAVIGPENPLSEGVADLLDKHGLNVIGPKKKLAQIETSKSFTRNLQKKYNIPGAPRYQTFDSMNGVDEFLNVLGEDFVVKYDGLANPSYLTTKSSPSTFRNSSTPFIESKV